MANGNSKQNLPQTSVNESAVIKPRNGLLERPMASSRSVPPGDFADQNRFDHDPEKQKRAQKRDPGCGCGS